MTGKGDVFEHGKCGALFGQHHGGPRPVGHKRIGLHDGGVACGGQFALADFAHQQHRHDVAIAVGVDEVAGPQDNRLDACIAVGLFHRDPDLPFAGVRGLRRGFIQNPGLVAEVIDVARDNDRRPAGTGGGDDLCGDRRNCPRPVMVGGRVQPVDDDVRAHCGGGHIGAAFVLADGPARVPEGFGCVAADLAGPAKDKNSLFHWIAPAVLLIPISAIHHLK